MIPSYSAFPSSILNDSIDAIDFFAPVTFLVWLQQKQFTTTNVDDLFTEYRQYVINWGKKKNKNIEETNQNIRDSYIQVLRELVLNYSTEEEKRFISNADLTNPSDLDIVLPFFVSKIKQICLFYTTTREELKTASIQHNLRGTNRGIEKLIKKLIFDAAQIDQIVYTSAPCSFPPLSALARDLSIYIEELYDLEDSYYNLSPTTSFTSNLTAQRATLSAANVNVVDSNLYINFKEAIIDAINQYPFFIQSLGTNNFTITPVLSGTELDYLKSRDFITYLSGGPQDLRINLLRKLAPKYLGNNFYYLSTGTNTDYVSGILFSVQPLSGAATLNILNRQYPSTATVPSLESLFTEYQIGRLFLPQHQGVLIHNTPSKTYQIDTSKLIPNTVYAFPDPTVVGNVSYNSSEDTGVVPITYTIDVSWNKRSRGDQFVFGDVLSNSYNPLYYGYESREQDVQLDIAGLSKTYDNIQFWEGMKQEKWADDNLWPGLNKVDVYPIDQRQSTLLVNDQTPVYWGNDVYGNEYGLLKTVNTFKTVSGLEDDTSIIQNSETVLAPEKKTIRKSVFDKKYTTPGTLYFRNGVTNLVSPAQQALSAVFFKYPSFVKDEMNNSLLYFSVYYDTFVLETSNYVVLDSIIFDYSTNKVTINSNPGTYIRKSNFNSKLERFAGEWYSESDKILYLCFLTLSPVLSGSNYRRLYPTIYKTPLTNIALEKVYPDPLQDLGNVYSISANFIDPPQVDLFRIDGISFSRLDKTNLFNLTYLGKNLNSLPFFVNEQIQKNDPYYYTYEPELFKPFYFSYDNNYGNPYLPFFVKYAGSSTGIMGTHYQKGEEFLTGQSNFNGTTYLFCDGIKPVQINRTGKYIIQFDWETYSEVGFFIGCNYIKVKNVGDNIVWIPYNVNEDIAFGTNTNTAKAVILDTYNEQVLATTTQLFSSYTFGTSGLDTTYYVNSGYLAAPLNVGDSIITVDLRYAPSLTAAHTPDSYLSQGRPYEARVQPPDSRLSLEFSLLSGQTVYYVNSFTNGTTAAVVMHMPSLCAYSIGTPVYFYNWFDKVVDITTITAIGVLSAVARRPVYPDPSIIEIDVTTNINGFTANICDSPDSIYRSVTVKAAGPGTGIVLSEPFCIDCGPKCTEIFGYGTELALIASANYYSKFDRWEGTACAPFGSNDCLFLVTSSASVTAFFEKLPFYIVYITSDAIGSRIRSSDLVVDVSGPAYSVPFNYLAGTVIALSTVAPISGYEFRGYKQGPCVGFEPIPYNLCQTPINGDVNFEVNWQRYYDFSVSVQATSVSATLGQIGTIISLPLGGGGIGNPTGGINCPGTCTATFTGTGNLLLGNSLVTLSAKSQKGYRLVEWIGSPCQSSAISAAKAVPFGDAIEAVNPCSFFITENVAMTGRFDIGYYTLTLVVSGDGVGRMYSTQDSTINYENGNPLSVNRYSVLSGSSLTMRVSGYSGTTVLGLSSKVCPPLFGVDICNITITDDTTVIALLSTGKYYTLDMIVPLTCGVTVTASPVGFFGNINCPSSCQAVYPGGRIVTLTQLNSTSACFIKGFTGDGVSYIYQQGDGITISTTQAALPYQDFFALFDNSLILDPQGAPYYQGTGITITNAADALVAMTENRSVTAVS